MTDRNTTNNTNGKWWKEWKLVPAPRPLLQKEVSQQVVQAYNLILSPITIQPGSHFLVQFLSKDHIFIIDVEFSVLVVKENLLTWKKENSVT